MLTLIFLIAFPFAIWNAWRTIQRAKESVAWPGATGTITASGTKKVMFRSQPRIAYSYVVNGTSYTGERISFAAGVPPKETETVLARYPVGKEVTVHFAPEKPSEAVLEPGANRNVTAQLRLLITCFVIIVLVHIGLYYLRSTDAIY
jgi:hypothetical protein